LGNFIVTEISAYNIVNVSEVYCSAELRKTFTGKLFKNVDHIVNDNGQYLYCKYWYPEGTVRYVRYESNCGDNA